MPLAVVHAPRCAATDLLLSSLRPTCFCLLTAQTEIAESVEAAVPMVFVTVAIMLLYSIVFLFTQVLPHSPFHSHLPQPSLHATLLPSSTVARLRRCAA